jgi:hypothetical protein
MFMVEPPTMFMVEPPTMFMVEPPTMFMVEPPTRPTARWSCLDRSNASGRPCPHRK